MNESTEPSRRVSMLRLLAAALAGAFGAFGAPIAVHAAPPPAAAVPAASPAVSADATPD
ncbi:MAG: hypothetical protein ABSH27_07655 [Solirubrobacteraceae bacterium]